MSLDDCDVVAEAKSPFSTSATDTPRRARSRATPAPAMPPPMMTTSYSASSSGQGRVFIESGGPSKTVEFRRGGHGQPRRAPSITLVATRRATGAPFRPLRSGPAHDGSLSWIAGQRDPSPHRTARRQEPSTSRLRQSWLGAAGGAASGGRGARDHAANAAPVRLGSIWARYARPRSIGNRNPFPLAAPPAAPSHDLGSAEEVADRGHDEVRSRFGDAGVAGGRDAGEDQDRREPEPLSHHDVRFQAVADDHAFAGRHPQLLKSDLEDDRRGLTDDDLDRAAGDRLDGGGHPCAIRNFAVLGRTRPIRVGRDQPGALTHRLERRVQLRVVEGAVEGDHHPADTVIPTHLE